jgi:alpha-ribazole phosphatase
MGLAGMGRIHLLRHAEPVVLGVLLGRADPPLRSLPSPSELAVASVFSSPLRRARDTAIALFPAQPVVVLENLIEVSLGDWDGLAWADLERRDPELASKKLGDWFDVTPPGGENYAEIKNRATAALREIQTAKEPVAVVAHLGINAFLWHLLTGSPVAGFQQNYLEVKTYEYTDERRD